MDTNTRSLLSKFLERELACERDSGAVEDNDAVVRSLVELENESWSESPFEMENKPLLYRKIVSAINDLNLLEKRYAECGHDYLKQIISKRYTEVLDTVTDPTELRERCVKANPGLRLYAIARFEQVLPQEIARITPDAIPAWFIRLLRQPAEILNFLSSTSCSMLAHKARQLLN